MAKPGHHCEEEVTNTVPISDTKERVYWKCSGCGNTGSYDRDRT